MILIVDDKPQNLQFLGNLLTQEGYEPAAVLSGRQALDFLQTTLPDLILLDIMMPELNGFEVCRRMKKDMRTRHVPVIFLTALTDTEDVVKGFEEGGVDYVTKPFRAAELLARIKTHIELKTLRGMLPICAKCKSIRDDEGFWNEIADYLQTHSEVLFTHSLCPACCKELYGDQDWYTDELAEG